MFNKITLLDEIQKANKIVIVVDAKHIAVASALYTYILTKHKSVTLVCCDENLDARFSFLPWFDNIKIKKPTKSDLEIELNIDALELYKLFKDSSQKLNKKIATALYAGLLQDSDGFLNPDANGMVFAMAYELIQSKADYKTCTKELLQTKSLALFRLKALMFKSMVLRDDAKEALFKIDESELICSGASMQDCDEVLRESLSLFTVQRAVLKDSKDKILKVKEK